MTVAKYNFSIIGGGDNDIFTNTMQQLTVDTSSLFPYAILVMVFAISFWVFNRKTQDIGKSLLSSTHIVFIMGLLMYYWGVVGGFVLIDSIILLFIMVLEIIGISVSYYNRPNRQN